MQHALGVVRVADSADAELGAVERMQLLALVDTVDRQEALLVARDEQVRRAVEVQAHDAPERVLREESARPLAGVRGQRSGVPRAPRGEGP